MAAEPLTREERCPECKGWGTVETSGYQNDGHGRQEHVYLGRTTCQECNGRGIIAAERGEA